HFCEKARWALDYKQIAYEPIAILPGFHLRTVRKVAPKSSVPVLLSKDTVVQGAGEIIDFLDQTCAERMLTPQDTEQRRACEDLERSMDNRLGVNLRRILYDCLLEHPRFIQACFTHTMPKSKQILLRMYYPLLRQRIRAVYVISDAAVARSRQEFERALSELASRFEHREFLIGEQFSRADLSIAAMLSLLVMPKEHPFPWGAIPDERSQLFVDQYRDHAVSHWVCEIYRNYRIAKPA
ncbi:MAG: glutathione S-transferase, partial [Gammaproteobacteria bacterium]